MTWQESITLAVAITGAVLGIVNFWRATDLDRVRLKVIPQIYISADGLEGICVQVVNLSAFPITLSQVGFTLPDKQIYIGAWDWTRLNEPLPKRMEPRTAFTFYFRPGTFEDSRLAFARNAFAKTACGSEFTGVSAAFYGAVKECMALHWPETAHKKTD